MRKIAIGDIHGCLLSFKALLEKIALTTTDELYLLGDYIDRGPDSKKVIDLILKLKAENYQVHCIAGNHDFAIMDAKTDPSFFDQWYFGWGGKQTMEGFDVTSLQDIPQLYWDFFSSLELVLQVDDFILVHAGLDFLNADPLRPDVNMLYIRNWYDQINYNWLGERYILHGHTPVAKNKIENMLGVLDQKKVLDIDAGCFGKHLPGKGFMCAFDLTNRELYFQKCLDNMRSYWS